MSIINNHSEIYVHPAAISPKFGAPRILCEDQWSFVELWLRGKKQKDSLSYWLQAKEFLNSAQQISVKAAPLPLYYCFLNATKALLTFRSELSLEKHGVSGGRIESARTTLGNEEITFPTSGIAASLSTFLGKSPTGRKYSLQEVLGNLPFIHRAFQITFPSETERFIPLKSAQYCCTGDGSKRYFYAEPYGRFQDARTLQSLPKNFEHYKFEDTRYIRRKKKVSWGVNQRSREKDIDIANINLLNYHRETRKNLMYISGPENLWYIRKPKNNGIDDVHSLVLMFAAMHRLSELSRYDPVGFSKLLESKPNWLITEFVSLAPRQFIYEIATEITGELFSLPRLRGVN